MSGPASRVVFLGLDGATDAVLRPAFDRGWMPNLEALWQRSATGTLWSSEPMVTPVAWTSFLTGCNPPTHGIHEFHYVDPVDRSILPNHAGRIRVPTIWDTLSDSGAEVVSLGLPMTYPPPDVRGLVVAGSDAPGLKWAFAQCPEFGEEILGTLPEYSHKVLWKRRPRSLDELRSVARRNREVFRAQAEAAERADARCDWAAMMVHFHNLDGIQHRLWPYLDIDETAANEPDWSIEVVECLRELDRAVGRLLELASRRDAAVVALSDHGFGPCRALVDVNGLLCRAGLQRRLPYGTRLSYRLRRVRDRFNRWKRRRTPDGTARRGPRSIEGEVGCDWSKTVAFAPFGQLCGSIFLNPDLVSGSSAASRVIGEIIDACRGAEDPETGLPLFADAFDVAERYNLDPAAEGLPDVLAPSTDGYQAMAKWAPFCRSLLRPDPNLPATHRGDGVLAIDAPGVRPGPYLDAELPDVAPTALALLGVPVPAVMEGRIIDEAFDHADSGSPAGGRPVSTDRDARSADPGSPGSVAFVGPFPVGPAVPAGVGPQSAIGHFASAVGHRSLSSRSNRTPTQSIPRTESMDEIRAAIRDYLLTEFLPGEDPSELSDQTPLITGGVLDSISTLKLVVYLEERFEISLSAYEAGVEHLDTVDQISALVSKKRAA